MRGRTLSSAATIAVLAVSCTQPAHECIVAAPALAVHLRVTKRFNTRSGDGSSVARADELNIILKRDRVARDTVWGHTTARFSDLGVELGPDTLPWRPYLAVCQSEHYRITIDPRVSDRELWLDGDRRSYGKGTWATAGAPYIEGSFTLSAHQ